MRVLRINKSRFLAMLLSTLVILISFVAAIGQDKPRATKKITFGVSVVDSNGLPADFDIEKLRLSVNGKPIDSARSVENKKPLYLTVLVDRSGSMRTTLRSLKDTVGKALESVRLEERIQLISFVDSSNIVLDVGATNDPDALRHGIKDLAVQGGPTAVFDATAVSVEQLAKVDSSKYRRFLVVISDGEDRGSEYKLEDVEKTLAKSNVPVVFVSLGEYTLKDKKERRRARRDSTRLAESSGGVAYHPKSKVEFDSVLKEILETLRSISLVEVDVPVGVFQKDLKVSYQDKKSRLFVSAENQN